MVSIDVGKGVYKDWGVMMNILVAAAETGGAKGEQDDEKRYKINLAVGVHFLFFSWKLELF